MQMLQLGSLTVRCTKQVIGESILLQLLREGVSFAAVLTTLMCSPRA